MKLKNSYKAVLFILVVSATFFACQQEDTAPSSADRDKFLGTWITHSSGPVHGTLDFTMTITAGTSSAAQIKIENFDEEGSGTFILGEVSGNNVSLTQTTINGDVISGSGSYNSNGTLSFTYTVNDGQTNDSRTATAHK
jgi:hypothetical protein